MKKNYFLTLVAALFTAVSVSAADNLVGTYKLTGLSAGDIEALGDIDPDATFRILPGDGDSDYILTGVGGYGCYLLANYDEASSTITATDMVSGGFGGIVLSYIIDIVAIDDTEIPLTVTPEGDLVITDEIIILKTDMTEFTEDVVGVYNSGLKLTKQTDPTPSLESLAGTYKFSGEMLDGIYYETSPAEFTMTVQASNNDLSITFHLEGGDITVSANYYPEASIISFGPQQDTNGSLGGWMLGNTLISVSANEWDFIAPMVYNDTNTFSYGKAVKTSSSAIETTAAETTTTVYASNGAIYVKSDVPAAVQIYNIAGATVYANPAVSAPITTLPHGIYFVKVAGNAKAVAVKL